jgi:hypothetical protein
MKTKTILTILIGISAALCLGTQCEKEQLLDQLPPETQTGANTFGCYVNGELFVNFPANAVHPTQVYAQYFRSSTSLMLYCHGQIGNMYLYVDNPLEGKYNAIRLAKLDFYSTQEYFLACEDCEQIFISKFDTIGNIVSGVFEFLGQHANQTNDGVMQYSERATTCVTDGRFDIELQIND